MLPPCYYRPFLGHWSGPYSSTAAQEDTTGYLYNAAATPCDSSTGRGRADAELLHVSTIYTYILVHTNAYNYSSSSSGPTDYI